MTRQGLHCVSTFIVCFCLLSGCSRAPALSDDLETYSQRLANVLDIPAIEIQTPTPLVYPNKHIRTLQIPELAINLREFHALNKCPLSKLVADRNSALGKIQAPSLRLNYEHALIDALTECRNMDMSSDIKKSLSDWLIVKQEALPLVYADMLQNSGEIKQHLSVYRGSIYANENDGVELVQQALHVIIGAQQEASSSLEESLQALQRRPLFSQMVVTQQTLKQNLEKINQWLTPELAQVDCMKSDKTQAEYMRNVFNRYFINDIQATAAMLDKYHYILAPLYTQLASVKDLHPEFRTYLLSHNESFKSYRKSLKKHVSLWQQFFSRCEMSPV